MKKLIFLFIIFLVTAHGFAQTSYYELDDDHNGSGHVYTARDSVLLKAGFEYAAPTGFTFTGEIDESQIMDESYLENPIDPDSCSLNTNYAVGAINGSLNVTPTGAATYTIPIAVPPGTAGMQPQLSVGYNSQGGNGLIGMGWNLQGLSMITRTGTTLYHDGYIDGVDFDSNDQYTWNGQRLIYLEPIPNTTDTLYATESESFARIVAHDSIAGGPVRWTVWTKDGTRLSYGATKDAQHKIPYDSCVIRWMLDTIMDCRGNYMVYKYYDDYGQGDWHIENIRYTGNESSNPELTPYNTVKFYYSERNDSTIAYVGGAQQKQTLLLRKIRTFAQGDFAHEYRFRYYDNGFTSHLNEITEVSHTGERLNSTVVGWGESQPFYNDNVTGVYYNMEVTSSDSYSQQQFVPGDYNGDGIEDLLIVYKDDNVSNKYYLKWYDFSTTTMHNLECISNSGCLGLSFSKADFNGDGFDDLLRVWYQDDSPDWKGVDLYINDASGDANPFDWKQNNGAIQNISVDDSPRFYTVDLDGNGKSEVLKFYYDRTNTQKYIAELFEITGFSSPFSASLLDTLQFDNTNLFAPFEILDFNGNGKAEITHVKNVSVDEQFKSFEYNTDTEEFETVYDCGFPTESHKRYYSDFNGDGKTDVLTYEGAAKWELHFSTGNGWEEMDCPVYDNYNPNETYNNIFTADVNGDGKGDIVMIYPLQSFYDQIKVHFCQGQTFISKDTIISKDYIELHDNITCYGDFNGDGGNEFLFDPWDLSTNDYFIKLSFYANDESRLVTQINDGFNRKTEIDYQRLICDGTFYQRGTILPAYPLCEIAGPIQAVKWVKSDQGDLAQNMQTTNYTYKSLKLHKQGKGMMGMTEFTSVNSDIGMKTVSTFDLNATWFIPYLSQQKTYIGDNLMHSQTTDYTYVTSQVGGASSKRFLSLPQTVVKTDVLWNNSHTSSYNTYDNFGNVTELVVTTKNNGTTEGTTTTTSNYMGASGNGSQCDYLPDLFTVAQSRPGETTITNSTNNDYSNGLLSTRTLFSNHLGEQVYETYGRDDFGNVTSLLLLGSSVTSRTSTTTYDSRGRFPITQTNPLLWSESFEYDHRTGQVLKATDVNGHITHYKYDGFGRARLTEYPDGINLIENVKWYTGQDVSNARYYNEAQATGSPPVKAWYDRVGRELKTQSSDFAGNYVYTLNEYDSKGRKYKVYKPYATSTGMHTQFAYDNLGRLYQTTLPTGVKLRTDYSHIDDNEITSFKEHNYTTWDDVTKTMNAFGEPVTIDEEAGGTIAYTYTSAGQPKSITSNGSTINITYDTHGNRHTLNDPDATPAASGGDNLITTEYNAFDELIEQTDGRGKTYTMSYDDLSRIKTRTGTETNTWTYSTTAGDLGELSSVSCNNNTSQSFTYDVLGRLTSQTENILGESFTQYYTYDELGRLQSQSWNSGFGIKHKYNSYDYLDKVQTASDETIWDAESYNTRGQITSYKLGANYRTTRDWDTYGFPEEIVTTKISPAETLTDQEYVFDPVKGNLTQRKEWKYYAFESFTYDDLHRLTSETVSTNTRSTSFTGNGNITNRSDIGDYDYDNDLSAGPHAVTDLTNTTGNLLPTTNQRVDYTDFNKASHISQGSKDYFITYGHDRLRRKTTLLDGATDDVLLSKYYVFGDYEKETDANGTRHLHYISGGDGLAAIYIKYSSGEDSLYYVMKDHLGSLVGLINSESGKVYRQSFDAWGRNRNPEDWTYTDIPDDFPIMRGYTGHESLKWFGLINMNGRMYDAGLCRFLSPDPYVQMPDYTQNFNRYSYALNNPLIYTDPSGEFFLGTLLTGGIEFIKATGQSIWDFGETIFVDGGLEFWHGGSGEAWADYADEFNNSWAKFDPSNPGTRFNNAWKIDVGGFKTDPNRTTAGRGLQLLSRWTWELPQTMLGKGFSHSSNIFGAVDRVDYFGGATFVTRTNQDSRWGVSLGNYINLSIRDDIVGNFEDRVINDPLFMHEYGHTFDSQRFGMSYLLAIGIPSLISASSASHVDGEPYGVTTHDFRWYEMRANRNAATYFSKYYGVDWSIYETMYPRRKR